MKLLFDENLSPLLPSLLAHLFPSSVHLREVGMKGASDAAIWEYAAANGLTIVTRDDDFRQLAVLHGHPPKVVWVTVGNCSTNYLAALLRENQAVLQWFERDEERSIMTLDIV